MKKKWFQTSYRRSLVDMHILDWNERFMSEFDPRDYVHMQALAGVDSTIVFASSSVGTCYWPTKVGRMHKGLKGRDILGEIIDSSHQRGINVMLLYECENKWAWDNHPDWRTIDVEGKEVNRNSRRKNSRRRFCCYNNSPYRDFILAQIEELCKGYEFEGVWFDGDHWGSVCYCPSCRKRYASEVGSELPRIPNWQDPKWVRFQRKREEWLADFACLMTSAVKKRKPEAAVVHNFSRCCRGWRAGMSRAFAKQNDFLDGDASGDLLHQSFYNKLLYNLSENRPLAFMTSYTPKVPMAQITTPKSRELLEAQLYLTLAYNAAFCFIDDVNPTGTLNQGVYETMREIFCQSRKYEEYLGGELCQEVAIYFSFESNADDSPHYQAAICAAKSLSDCHIPFGVITKKNLEALSSYQVIILPSVMMVDQEEIEALKQFVASGGGLYVSKNTSLFTTNGERKNEFLLSDILGVSYLGETKETTTYISPTDEGRDLFPSVCSVEYPLIIFNSQVKVKAAKGAKVLAALTLPYTDPREINRFASLRNDPPGISTDYPSIVFNEYGKGKTLYVAGEMGVGKSVEFQLYHGLFTNLIRLLSSKPFSFEADAPKSVQINLFRQEDKRRYLINLINFQAELPNIPVRGIKLRIKLHKKEAQRLIKLPEEKELAYQSEKDSVEFDVPELKTFLMLALDYR